MDPDYIAAPTTRTGYVTRTDGGGGGGGSAKGDGTNASQRLLPAAAGSTGAAAATTRLYYEVRGPATPSPATAVVLVMGAFATLRHYDELADVLAGAGYTVLAYDHRGIGKSSAADPRARQTSTMLGEDCVAVINSVFGPTQAVHLYGASMGGCVAQHAALILYAQHRLVSLYLAVTSRGTWFRIPFPASVWRFLLRSFLIKERRRMVEELVPKCFDREFLEHTDSQGRTMRDRWTERWTREYPDWFSFHDVVASASQCSVFATHYLSDRQLAPLVGACYITVHIAAQDELMPPAKQRELGALLKAHLILFQGGHMGGEQEKRRFYDGVLRHLHDAVAQTQQPVR